MTDQQSAEVRASLQHFAGDHRPTDRPEAAPHGLRWSDMDAAVARACASVEAAVVRRSDESWGYRYELKTIEDRPGSLIVRRLDDERIYMAEASFGRFDGETVRADQLVEALDHNLRDLGRRRRFNEH